MNLPHIRTGIGYDIHPMEEGRRLIIGGVEIASRKGLGGHSDADVLCHAVADALLGAAGQGDLGSLFPDTDPRYKDFSSVQFLEIIRDQLKAAGYLILHIDTVIIAQAPKLSMFMKAMRSRIAKAVGIQEEAVNIKAKSPEGLGALGRGEGIAAQAVCTIGKE